MKQNYIMSGNALRKRFRNCCYLFSTILLFIFGSLQTVEAQKMESLPGPIVVCPANFEDQHSRMAMKQMVAKKSSLTGKQNATADISIVFGPGAQGNAEVQAAFQFAADIWAEEIVSSVPIVISADFANLGAGVLASAGPTQIFQNFPNAPQANVFYPSALANSLAGERLALDEPADLVVNIGNGIPWYFGTDGNTPAGQFDFVTVALHEIGHGLGFFDGGNVNNATGVGTLGFAGGIPVTFDTFIVDGEGNSILDLPNPSVELGDFLTSGDVFVNGQFAVAALGGNLPRLFAPNPFQGGSSIAHWDEATFGAGDPNSLMTPQVGASESNFNIGDITRGHFRDMGWVLATQAPITVVPGSLTAELFVEESVTQELLVTNNSEETVTVDVLPSGVEVVVGTINPVELTLAPGESATINVELTAVGVVAGQYEETIDLNITGFDTFVSVPVSVRVLDGTEAPMIVVNPESFDETVNEGAILTRDLTISNTGNEVLNYSITVNGEDQITFESKVATTNAAIAANGFTTERIGSTGTGTISDLVSTDGTLNKIVSSLYATDFEDFTAGELNGQGGWSTQPAGFWNITDANPADGAQHVRGTPNGSGALGLGFSPLITPGSEPFMVASARISVEGNDTSFEFIPQSPTAGSVNTRVRFNADGSVDVLDATAGAFVPISTPRPTGYFDIRVVIDTDDLGLAVFFDDALVFTGTGFAPFMEQIVLFSDNAGTETIIDVDTIEVTDGDENAFFLTVSPIAGTVAEGGDSVVQVRFDARALDAGVYNATINIASDDPNNPTVDVPVTLTVLVPPTIMVAPDALSESVDVTVDDPPVRTATFTVSNAGESPLDFTTSLGATVFTPPSTGMDAQLANLDMSVYGVGNTIKGTYASTKASKSSFGLTRVTSQLENSTMFNDSIFYDSGINFPDSFGGVTGQALTTAVKFDAETDFTLTAVRNAYRTEAVTDVAIILEIYRGGATPADGELLLSQTTTTLAADGIFELEELMTAQTFAAGESFWVVHKYPNTIGFPQGQDDDTSNVRPDTYFFSLDGGETFTNLDAFVFLTRALSGATDGGPYITLSPSSGSVAPGESVDVEVTFDGSTLSNGIFETDILVDSNDPATPTATVATTFEVSGQTSNIAVSEELLLFDNVFVGASNARSLIITNNGLSQLTISDIASDNPDFTPDFTEAILEAGEELELTVNFAPSSLGSINGILTITSDAANTASLEVILNGVGVEPPMARFDPQEVSATTDAGTTIDVQVALVNDGNSPLQYSFPDLAVAAARANPNAVIGKNADIITFDGFDNPTKELTDSRVGVPVVNALGSDNSFGYTWIDNDEPDGPVFNFQDITGVGVDITGAVGQDGTASGPISFPFEFYGVSYESVFINANGFLSFTQPTGFTFINNQIPIDDNINNVIAVFWDDIEPLNGGSVHVADFGNRFVVQWTDVNVFLGAAGESATFQVVLYDDGNIDMFYQDVDTASFADNATVGIENADGSDGAQVAFNTAYIRDGLALRFVKPAVALTRFISSVDPISGVVPAGGSRDLTVTLDATDLNDGVFFDELTVSSNAPDKSTSTALFELTVIGAAEIQVSDEVLAFEPLFLGLSAEAGILIENIGTNTLEISGLETNNGDYTLDLAAPVSLEPGASTILNITFTPSTVGVIDGELEITSNDSNGNESFIVMLSGIGVDPPVIAVAPDAINVSLNEDETTIENITISNNGGSPLDYVVSPPILSLDGTSTVIAEAYEQLEYETIRSKEEVDSRVGPSFRNASGGPGSFGYTWVDSNSGGPDFDFIDISATGQQANVGADGNETVALPFGFDFYGETQNEVTISANGFVTFSPIVGIDFINAQIPNTGSPNNFIAGMWDDIEPQNGTGVFYEGNAERFIVQFEATPRFLANDAPVTFQIILFPDGSFKMQYADLTTALLTSSTVGIEGPGGTSGLQVVFNNVYLEENLAITFTPPVMGTLQPGESDEIPVEISAVGLEGGNTYTGNVTISSNDPVTPQVQVPVTLEVLDGPQVVSFLLVNADTDEAIGPLNDGDVINLNDFPDNSFNVVAVTGEFPVGSVVFDYNGTNAFQKENVAPYALGGDRNGDFKPLSLALGTNTVTATAYSGRNGSGEVGGAQTISFEVINETEPELMSFTLVNSSTNMDIGPIADGDVLDLADYPENGLSIVAETNMDGVGSVIFGFNGVSRFQVENVAPYALDGDIAGNYNAVNFPLGINTITATVYTGRNGGGAIAAEMTINIDVIDSSAPEARAGDSVAGKIFPNPVEDIAYFSLEGSDEQTLNGTLFNLLGQVVKPSFDFDLDDTGNGFLDMSNISQGTYILRLTDSKGDIVSQVKVLKR